MLKIQRAASKPSVLSLSGEITEDDLSELEDVVLSERNYPRLVLDLTDVTLAGGEAITFLLRCEKAGVRLRKCPAYVREWMRRANGEVKDR